MKVIQDTGKYQLMPSMAPAEFEALKADIAERGVVVPIDVDEDGEILDGHHRYCAWRSLKKNEPPPTIVRAGLSEQEKRAFARRNNILRRHLTREQVRQLIAEQLKDTPDWADNRIAKQIGVDGKTVEDVRSDLIATSEIPKFDRLIGTDGKTRPAKQPRQKREVGTFDGFFAVLRKTPGFDGSVDSLPSDLKLALFEAGIPKNSVIVTTVTAFPEPDLSETEIRAWQRYQKFLIAQGWDPNGSGDHIDWLLRHDFKTPDEWLGSEGDEYRARIKMRAVPAEVRDAWAAWPNGGAP